MSTFWWSVSGTALLLALAVWWRYGSWVEARRTRSLLEDVKKDQRGLRRQMANIISMLLRAGYKRGPTLDWSDDEQRTRVMDAQDTQWDLRKK